MSLPNAITREDFYLNKIANPSDDHELPDAITRTQYYLKAIAENAGGGGVQPFVYSETEHIVGTWIDGNPIYEKTVPTGAISAGTTDHQVTMNCTNVDKVINYEVIVYVESGAAFALPLAVLTSAGMQEFGATEQGYNKTSDKFRIDTGAQRAIVSGYITMRYTKVTTP